MLYNYEDLLPHMRAIVASEGEDFTYTLKRWHDGGMGCHYVFDGKLDCGIGRLLHRIGVPMDAMGHGNLIDDSIDTHYEDLDIEHDLQFTPDAKALMESFQQDQDELVPWGEALREAIIAAERIAAID